MPERKRPWEELHELARKVAGPEITRLTEAYMEQKRAFLAQFDASLQRDAGENIAEGFAREMAATRVYEAELALREKLEPVMSGEDLERTMLNFHTLLNKRAAEMLQAMKQAEPGMERVWEGTVERKSPERGGSENH